MDGDILRLGIETIHWLPLQKFIFKRFIILIYNSVKLIFIKSFFCVKMHGLQCTIQGVLYTGEGDGSTCAKGYLPFVELAVGLITKYLKLI